MRKLTANYIFPISSSPIKNGVLTIDDDGTILRVEDAGDQKDVEVYEGILCPGFVNTHCHLELSHLKGRLPVGEGMVAFIKGVIANRGVFSEQEQLAAIAKAEDEMLNNGIVAVGDISNTNNTVAQKQKGNLHYHTFIEVFDLNPDKAAETFKEALALQKQFGGQSSIVPHAPYTVSKQLFAIIAEHALANRAITSIHNQESKAEIDLLAHNKGELFDMLQEMGLAANDFKEKGKSVLENTLSLLAPALNTFTTGVEIEKAMQSNYANNLFWCTCPNANKYINEQLPDYLSLIKHKARVTIGTDSLASNWSLSVLEELKTIAQAHPTIPLNTLLTWATKNGADFLGVDQLGSLEPGMQPGILCLQQTDNLSLKKTTSLKRIV